MGKGRLRLSAYERDTARDVLEFSLGPAGKVDRERGVIFGVKYLGPRSSNVGPDGLTPVYPMSFRRESQEAYRDAPMFVDHPPEDKPWAERSIRDRIGRLEPTEVLESGSYGNLHLNLGHPMAEQVLWAAENDPGQLCLSHNARATGRKQGGEWIAEGMKRLRSVDLVAAGGTTRSLFESQREMPMDALNLFRELLERDEAREVLEMEVDMSALLAILTDDSANDAAKVSKALALLASSAMPAEKPAEEEGDMPDESMEGRRENQQTPRRSSPVDPSSPSDEVQDLRRKVAELELREAARAREDALDRTIREARLPESAITADLRETLLKLDPEDAARLVKAQAKNVLEQRPESGGTSGVADNYTNAVSRLASASRPAKIGG